MIMFVIIGSAHNDNNRVKSLVCTPCFTHVLPNAVPSRLYRNMVQKIYPNSQELWQQ